MKRRPIIGIWVVQTARDPRPRLACSMVDLLGTTDEEQDRAADEAHQAGLLLGTLSAAQTAMLHRLAGPDPERGLRFPFAATLKRFLAATRGFDEAAAARLTDEQLQRLWRDADPDRN